MKIKSIIQMHFIEEDSGDLLYKQLVYHVPRVNDELRFGGQGNEKYYSVTRVIWVYDELNHPFSRVNIGIKLIV